MPYADLNGAHIHFTDSGGEGEVIVFSHGLLFSGSMFERQVAHFRSRYRCITFDHRGQGRSGVSENGYDMETLAKDATSLLRHLGIGHCHFVGLSMGGFVGMRLAARNPGEIRTLTLLGTSARGEPAANRPKYRLLNFVARWVGLRVVVGQVMPILFGQTFLNDADRKEEKQRWAKAIAANHRKGITRAVSGVISREECVDILSEIAIPVGIGVGNEDVATVPAESRDIHSRIEGSHLTIFEGAGHSSSIETPEAVNDLIEHTIRRS